MGVDLMGVDLMGVDLMGVDFCGSSSPEKSSFHYHTLLCNCTSLPGHKRPKRGMLGA